VTWEELPSLLTQGEQANPDIIILVKIDRQARYDAMVRMMDTLDDTHMQRFSLIPMTADDEALLEGKP
jgi:biopolymer transport protein ExbD